jgi:glycosyltransferase involved in cell wall biosynthesis
MEKAAPRVSFLVATCDGEALVGETLRSILAQTFTDFEVIVIDDASSDRTREVVAGFTDPRIKLLTTPCFVGAPAARNYGFMECRGEYIAPVEQDDVLLPQRTARQVHYLDCHPDTVLVATGTERLVDGKRVASPGPDMTCPGYLRWALLVSNPLVWSSVLIRGDAIDTLGMFNRDERRYAEDYDLYHRLNKLGEIARIDEVLTLYRSHAEDGAKLAPRSMLKHAAQVLQDAYEPILHNGAARAAQVMTRHIARGRPAEDVTTLKMIEALLIALARGMKGAVSLDETARALIAAERAAIMERLVRGALRSGTISAITLHRAGLLPAAGLAPAALVGNSLVGLMRGVGAMAAAG